MESDYRRGIMSEHSYDCNVELSFYMSITYIYFFFFFNCMFYQLLRVQHSCSSTQSWGSVLPSIVETRDKNSWGCPLRIGIYSYVCILHSAMCPISNRNLVSFCA